MKIGNSTDVHKSEPLNATQADATRQAGSSATRAIEQARPVDPVQLSETSRGLGKSAPGGVSIREARVEEIRKAISEGSFHVNAHAVADKMIAEAAELIETLSRRG